MKYIFINALMLLYGSSLLANSNVKNEWIVKFESNKKAQAFLYAPHPSSMKLEQIADSYLLIKGEIDPANLKDPSVSFVQPNYIYKSYNYTTDDPKFNKQWGMNKIGIQKAWDYTRGNKEVIVAVIDTGVDYNHEDLKDNIWINQGEIAGNGKDDDGNGYIDDTVGWDFNQNDNDPMDETGSVFAGGNPGHGTHCAGNVAAVGDNGIGIAGAAPNVTIMPLRFLGKNGSGTTAMAVKAIHYAIDNGAQILSNSWGSEGTDGEDKALVDAIQKALDKDILFIAAAGNHSANNDTSKKAAYPASYPHENIISVAASSNRDSLASFSCYGKKTVDLAAPGTAIFSTVPGNGYQSAIIPVLANWDGTSMAAPHVSGVAALIKSLRPELTSKEIKEILLNTVTKISAFQTKTVSGGRLDAASALSAAEKW